MGACGAASRKVEERPMSAVSTNLLTVSTVVSVLFAMGAATAARGEAFARGSAEPPVIVLTALPGPPTSVEEAVERYSDGRDAALAPVERNVRQNLERVALALKGHSSAGRTSGPDLERMSPEEVRASLWVRQTLSDETSLPRAFRDRVFAARERLDQTLRSVEVQKEERIRNCPSVPVGFAGTGPDMVCVRQSVEQARRDRLAAVNAHLSTATAGFRQLREEVEHRLAADERMVERIITASRNDFLVDQALSVHHRSWSTVTLFVEEIAQETRLAVANTR
jgi:hypothetical protein